MEVPSSTHTRACLTVSSHDLIRIFFVFDFD
jgi:hypothetical protein